MNLGELRDAVKLRLRLPASGDPLLPDATVDSCIASALTDLSLEHEWPWLLTSGLIVVSTSTGLADVPADYVKARELVIGSGTSALRAEHVGLAQFLDAAQLGRYVWTEQGASIALTPVPTTAPTATLHYVRMEPGLSADTDEPLVPAGYHTVLVARGSYHGNVRRRKDTDMAVDAKEYADGIARMRKATAGRTGPSQIRSAFRVKNFATW